MYENHRELLKQILEQYNIELKSLAERVSVSPATLDRYLNGRQTSTTLETWLAILEALPEQARSDYLKALFDSDLTKWNKRDLKNFLLRGMDRLINSPGNSDQDPVEMVSLLEENP